MRSNFQQDFRIRYFYKKQAR